MEPSAVLVDVTATRVAGIGFSGDISTACGTVWYHFYACFCSRNVISSSMAQHSVFLVALVAAIILWGTGSDTLVVFTLLIAVVGGGLSLATRIFALRQARERRGKAISGLRLRKRPASEIEEMQKKPISLIDTDYEFVPGWITYVNLGLALASVLILAYAIVVRFLV